VQFVTQNEAKLLLLLQAKAGGIALPASKWLLNRMLKMQWL
jgi:hypothetical protein